MTEDTPPPETWAWWRMIEPDVEALARKIAAADTWDVDQMAVKTPAETDTPSGRVVLVPLQYAAPLWTFSIRAARLALAMRDEIEVERVLPAAAEPGTFTDDDPYDPTAAWKRENGLDAPQTAD